MFRHTPVCGRGSLNGRLKGERAVPMTTIAAKIGRTRLIVLILGVLVSSVITFSVVGTAGATDDGTLLRSIPTTHSEVEIRALAEAEALALIDAFVAYPSPCFLSLALCENMRVELETDLDGHLPQHRPLTLFPGVVVYDYQAIVDRLSTTDLETHPHVPFLNPANGHYYETITIYGGITWEDARAEAAARTFQGVQGHLVSMNSAAENDFVAANLPLAILQGNWLGGHQPGDTTVLDADPAADWEWVTGEPFAFTNWDTGEPDDCINSNCGSDALVGFRQDAIRFQPRPGGTWEDRGKENRIGGYVVEYTVPPVVHAGGDVTIDEGETFSQPATVGLAHYWPLDDGAGSGTVSDQSGNGVDGVLVNMDPNTDWVAGTPEIDFANPSALDFDGANDFVDFGNALNGGNQSLTVSLWYKGGQTAAGKNQVLIVKGLTGVHKGYELLLHDHGIGNTAELHWDLRGTLGDAFATAVPEPSVNTWHHVAGVLDRSTNTAILYVDGVAGASSTAAVGNLDNPVSLGIGALNRGGVGGDTVQFFDGQMDDVRLYFRALNPSEIRELANGTKNGFFTDPDGTSFSGTVDYGDGSGTNTLTLNADNTFALSHTYPVPGIYTVTVEISNGVSTGSDTLQVTVISADTTPPVVTVPDGITEEATSPSGAVVDFVTSAEDDVDGPVAVTCASETGSTFAIGDTTVSCSASDATGNVGEAEFTVTVEDTTAPDLTVPADISVEGDTTGGANVTLPNATATDIVDSAPSVDCDQSTGFFPLGETTVNCTATDAEGNSSGDSYTVTVVDTTPPDLTVPADINVEGDTTGGANVTLPNATATDIVDSAPSVDCDQSTGFFPLGETTVNCTATDAEGNSSGDSYTVTVVDTTPPDLTVPADISVECEAAGGTPSSNAAIQAFLSGASADDIVDANPGITNDAPAVCSLGDTVVTFTATDASGNSSSGTATITVVDTTAPGVTAALVPLATGGDDDDDEDDDEARYTVEYSCSDACDSDPDLTAVIAMPSLAGLKIKLKEKDRVKVVFDLEDGKVKIEGPDPEAIRDEIISLGGLAVAIGQEIKVEFDDDEEEAVFKFDKRGVLKIEGSSVLLVATCEDASGNVGTASAEVVPPPDDDDDEDDGDDGDSDEDEDDGDDDEGEGEGHSKGKGEGHGKGKGKGHEQDDGGDDEDDGDSDEDDGDDDEEDD